MNNQDLMKVQMSDPKWEELPFDCLVDIFGRVGWVSLVEGVPFVCKSWYQVSLSPLCWQSLIFEDDFPGPFPLGSSFIRFEAICNDDWPSCFMDSCEAFIKFVIRRSRGSANALTLPFNFDMTHETLRCIGEGCPSLKRLVLGFEPDYDDGDEILFSSMICKWKNLEALEVKGSYYLLNEIVREISIHCKNFVSLSAIDVKFYEREAYAITTLLPNLKFLCLRESRINRSSVVILLKGCKNLMHLHLDVSHDFDVDVEILNLAAHIPTSKFEVEVLDFDDDGCYPETRFDYDGYYSD